MTEVYSEVVVMSVDRDTNQLHLNCTSENPGRWPVVPFGFAVPFHPKMYGDLIDIVGRSYPVTDEGWSIPGLVSEPFQAIAIRALHHYLPLNNASHFLSIPRDVEIRHAQLRAKLMSTLSVDYLGDQFESGILIKTHDDVRVAENSVLEITAGSNAIVDNPKLVVRDQRGKILENTTIFDLPNSITLGPVYDRSIHLELSDALVVRIDLVGDQGPKGSLIREIQITIKH